MVSNSLLIFTSILGKFSNLTVICFKWVAQPPTRCGMGSCHVQLTNHAKHGVAAFSFSCAVSTLPRKEIRFVSVSQDARDFVKRFRKTWAVASRGLPSRNFIADTQSHCPWPADFAPKNPQGQCVPTITLPHNSIDACLIPLTKTNDHPW